jgi:hypothetical protein
MEILMAKAGRPKAPVSVTLTQSELSKLVTNLMWQCEMCVEEFYHINAHDNDYEGSPNYLQDTAEMFALTHKLKMAYSKKYGDAK